MENPFDIIEVRLSKIESLLLHLSQNLDKNEVQEEEQDQLFTIQEVADFLSLKVSTLYSMVSKGTIPVMKRSKRLYFSRNQLVEYLKEGQKKTYSELEKEAQSYINQKK